MMKTTYLFGAGASANAIPIVAKIPERLHVFIQILDKHETSESEIKAAKLKLKEKATWLLDSISFYSYSKSDKRWIYRPKIASVDTLAKQLLIREGHESENLRQLKLIMSLFFYYEHHARGIDLRYDSFYASLISDSQLGLPSIRILSWNYDLQFELAFTKYSGEDEININQSKLGVVSKHSTPSSEARNSHFSIHKLNGSASIFSRKNGKEIKVTNFDSGAKVIEDICRVYDQINENPLEFSPTFSFAWEQDENSFIEERKDIVSLAREAIFDTEVLVIVGYSFPFFNRSIDKKLFNELRALKKVYIQDLNPQIIKTRFEAVIGFQLQDSISSVHGGATCKLEPDTSQFVLPDELDI